MEHLPQRFRDQLNAELDNQPPMHSHNDRFQVHGAQDIFHIDPYATGWYFRMSHDYREGDSDFVASSASPSYLRDLCLWMKQHGLTMVQIEADGPEQPDLPMYEDGDDLPSCTQ